VADKGSAPREVSGLVVFWRSRRGLVGVLAAAALSSSSPSFTPGSRESPPRVSSARRGGREVAAGREEVPTPNRLGAPRPQPSRDPAAAQSRPHVRVRGRTTGET
jgi:hypothetical protein